MSVDETKKLSFSEVAMSVEEKIRKERIAQLGGFGMKIPKVKPSKKIYSRKKAG